MEPKGDYDAFQRGYVQGAADNGHDALSTLLAGFFTGFVSSAILFAIFLGLWFSHVPVYAYLIACVAWLALRAWTPNHRRFLHHR